MDDHQRFLAGLRAFVGGDGLHSLQEAADDPKLPSRSSVATHLKQLNNLLGFDATSHGVKRTEAGDRIGEDAKKLLEDLEQSIRRAREHLKRLGQVDRPVGIAMSTTIWMWGATPDKLPLTNALPGRSSAEFLVANSARVEQVVRDGWFEIGITAGLGLDRPADGAYEVEPFGTDEIVVLVPPEHEWADRRHLKAEDLAATGLIALDITANARQIVDLAMRDAGLDLAAPLEEAATIDLVLQEALRSKQPALIPKLVLGTERGREAENEGFRPKQVADLNLGREFVLISQDPRLLRPAAAATLDALRSLRFVEDAGDSRELAKVGQHATERQ
jgi:DNA-binding transcriptional LysR family regulator